MRLICFPRPSNSCWLGVGLSKSETNTSEAQKLGVGPRHKTDVHLKGGGEYLCVCVCGGVIFRDPPLHVLMRVGQHAFVPKLKIATSSSKICSGFNGR